MLTLVLLLLYLEIFRALGDLRNPSTAVGYVIAASILEYNFLCLTAGVPDLKSGAFYDLVVIGAWFGLLRAVS